MNVNYANEALSDAELDAVTGGSFKTDVKNLISDFRHPIDNAQFFVKDVKRTVKDILSFF